MKIIVDSEIFLEQISQEHASALFSLVQANLNNKLCYWCPDLKKTYASQETTIMHIDDAISKFQADRSPDLVIFYKGIVAGLISLSPIDLIDRKSEIGYWLGAEYEGHGLIARAFPSVIAYAKNQLQLKQVHVSTSIPNVRSQRLPVKFGFQKISTILNAETLEDGVVDHILWRLEF